MIETFLSWTLKSLPSEDHFIWAPVYRKPTQRDCYLDWNLDHFISAKKSVVCAFIYAAKNLCSNEGMIKEPEKKTSTPIKKPETGL